MVSILQSSYTKLASQLAKLDNSDSEALTLVLKHPALCSSSEIRIKNVMKLVDHIKDRGYPALIEKCKALLLHIEVLLKQLVSTQPLAVKRKSTNCLIKKPEVHSALKGLSSTSSSDGNNFQSNSDNDLIHHDIHHTQDKDEQHRSSTNTEKLQFPKSFEPNGPILTKNTKQEPIEQAKRNRIDSETSQPALTVDAMEAMLKNFGELMTAKFTHTINTAVQKVDIKVDKNAKAMQAMRTNLEIVQDQLEQQQYQTHYDHSLESIKSQSEHDTKQLSLNSPQVVKEHTETTKIPVGVESPTAPSPLIQSPSPTRWSPATHHGSFSTDISTILSTLKPFSGETDQYSLFITRFNSLVHNNPSIDIIMKQNMLISLLEGGAKDLITSDDLSEGTYEELRANLERVFNRKTDRRKQLIETYRNLPFHQTDYDQMEKDMMKHVCITNSLNKHQVSINDPFLIDSFVDKLPYNIMKSVITQIRNKTPSFLEVSTIVQTLISENRALDDAEQRKKNRTQITEVCTADINKISVRSHTPRHTGNQRKTPTTQQQSRWRSAPSSTYDPQGLLSPIGVASKSLMAKVWKEKLKWKDPLPAHMLPDWEKIKVAITENSYTIPRRITPAHGFTQASLIMFSDASKDHYATCAYLRFECPDNNTQVQLLFSKTRIRPINNENLTIPRMELLGVLTAAHAASTISKEVNITLSSLTFFCDNTAVLNWIIHKNPADKWVNNRVKTITSLEQEFTEKKLPPTFRYVPTDQNPADIASRGATLQQIKDSKLWNHGPDFLLQDQACWPKSLEQSPEDPKEFHCYTLKITPQQFPPHTGSPSAHPPHQYESIVPYDNTNSLVKLTTIVQKVMRWAHIVLRKRNERYPQHPYLWQSQTMKNFVLARMNKDEVQQRMIAHRYIIQDHYADAKNQLNIEIPKSSQIQKTEEGIYLYHNTYVNKKHPNMPKSLVYIIHKHRLARLIALDSHRSLLHQGPKDMATDIQQRYWIKRITALTRNIRKACVTCKRRHGNPYTYPFATSLPSVRTQSCRPFQHVGLDYFGPIGYKTEPGQTGKLWCMLTTCLVTRAVHLEVVPDNTTSSFLLAMRRLIGRRGSPKTIISDNAPAFTLGYTMINADISTMINSSQTLTSYLASTEIEVKQITPFAPWQGGVYERIVGIVKNMFYKTIGRLQLSFLEVETLIIECEGIINSRPITANPISISDSEAIRPVDFLSPQAELSFPNHTGFTPGTHIGITEKQTREYLKHLDNIRLQLWDQFYNSMYIGQHAPTYKTKAHCTITPQPNHVVLIQTPNLPRYRWPIARIIELIPSKDGKVRSVLVKCKNKLIERAQDESNEANEIIFTEEKPLEYIDLKGHKIPILMREDCDTMDSYWSDRNYGLQQMTEYLEDLLTMNFSSIELGKDGIWLMKWANSQKVIPSNTILREYEPIDDQDFLMIVGMCRSKNLRVLAFPKSESFVLEEPNFLKNQSFDDLYIGKCFWITIDNLLSIDAVKIDLQGTNLTSSDVNQFLVQWMNGGFPRTKHVTIEFKNNNELLINREIGKHVRKATNCELERFSWTIGFTNPEAVLVIQKENKEQRAVYGITKYSNEFIFDIL
ncbi:hypothetical protein CRE_21785 [Caenorhabditis remanei]|uniref:Integrase catalytic domain-containing protein n=1 Tax=Caenorhabditis remanei TaxID=31234 RepID=E3MEG2_CAERE|nr:hypothetical protein CRE_21785 [Caenorhabditis remanei]